ncbi:MAG: DUF58 domain-containing protein [Methanotrichaceae archaeon]
METEFLRELDRFVLMVRKRVSTTYTGARRSVKVGRGINPVGYREYRKGDDFKFVDWKAYARTEKLYVREHEEEKSLMVHLLLDASASMGYGNKFKFATMLAAGFSYLAVKENEKFSISKFAEMLEPGESKGSRRSLFHVIEDLDRIVPAGGTDIKRMSEQFDRLIRSTSLVIVISDFLDDIGSLVNSIYKLSSHDLILLQVLDPVEAELELDGDLRFIDMESKDTVMTRIGQQQREEYTKKLEHHKDKITEVCNHVSADFFSFTTDTPIFEAFSEVNSRAKVWRH